MLELEDAVARILAALPPPRQESILLKEAHRRILVEPVSSRVDLPGFDNSAMDGYAVCAEDLRTARAEAPVKLRLVGRVAAGESFSERIGGSACVRVFTGSPIPPGADSVVMQEDTRIEPDRPEEILVLDTVRRGENVRTRGQDVHSGSVLATAGQSLSAGRLSLLAAAGVEKVTVGRQPDVALISTGSELKEPGQSLMPGQIYESNRIGLGELMRQAGANPFIFPLVPDTIEATKQALSKAFAQCDLVVTTGGASVGELDLVRAAMEHLGGQIDFWKVAIKPGRPFVLGRFGDKLLFGLPGNPVSAFVTFLLLVRPALLRWQGAKEVELPTVPGVLAVALSNSGERRHFVRVHVDSKGAVTSAGAQASHLLSSLAASNGLLDVPPGTTLKAGSSVPIKTWNS